MRWLYFFMKPACKKKINTLTKRIPGFDLARAYAILGMFIVNFNTVFGSHEDKSLLGMFLNLFNGNSSSSFVILAGMGVALMTNKETYSVEEKKQLRSTLIKRSWFLFFIGLLLFLWWPADILHFYGGYMHIAALLLFVNRKYYLLAALLAIFIFHALLLLIPYENGWNFSTLTYYDFWTIQGFLRNTFFNGWNPIFPWVAYFLFGMWLGSFDWSVSLTRIKFFTAGLILFFSTELLELIALNGSFGEDVTFYITSDYIPPFLPFMLGTTGFTLILIATCIYLANKFSYSPIVGILTATGRMTLTHYISHLTVGIILFMFVSGKKFTGSIHNGTPQSPLHVLLFSIFFYITSASFSKIWKKKFKYGPVETLMRKITKT